MTRKHACAHLFSALFLLLYLTPARSDFIKGTQGSLEIRNFYFSRDFRDDTSTQSKREEWAQAFILRLQSGYTDGAIGFGLDAIGMLGLKLDSSPDRSGTGLLPRNSDRRAPDDYSTFAPTAKARFANSELRVGALTPTLPLMSANFSRLTPQVFSGTMFTSSDIDMLALTLGRITQVKARDSSDFEDLSITAMQGAYSAAANSDELFYLGADITPASNLALSLHGSQLTDIYDRGFAGLKYNLPLGPGNFFSELRYFDSRDNGRALAGEIDNRTLSTNFGYKINAHTFSGGYQKASGETAYVYLSGSDTQLFSEMQVSTFGFESERALYVRYDYDFAALGIPGLTFNVRYVRGDDIDPENISGAKAASLRAQGNEGEEWERATDITYVVQSGPLKSLSMRWRNATYRSNYTDSADENRLILSYQIKF